MATTVPPVCRTPSPNLTTCTHSRARDNARVSAVLTRVLAAPSARREPTPDQGKRPPLSLKRGSRMSGKMRRSARPCRVSALARCSWSTHRSPVGLRRRRRFAERTGLVGGGSELTCELSLGSDSTVVPGTTVCPSSGDKQPLSFFPIPPKPLHPPRCHDPSPMDPVQITNADHGGRT